MNGSILWRKVCRGLIQGNDEFRIFKDAEFNAAYLCIQHMKKLQGLLKELGFPHFHKCLFMDFFST